MSRLKKTLLFAIISLFLHAYSFSQSIIPDSSFNFTAVRVDTLGHPYGTGYITLFGRLILQPDQHILFVGNDVSQKRAILTRYNPNGSYDSTLGGNGIVSHTFDMLTYDALIQPDGKIVTVGGQFGTSGVQPINSIVSRYLADGRLDSNFNSNGLNPLNIPNTWNTYRTMNFVAGGKIMAFGEVRDTFSYANASILMTRYTVSGQLDSSFGNNGSIIHQVDSNSHYTVAASTLLSDGKMLIGGSVWTQGLGFDVFLARFYRDGSIDSTFGINGFVRTDVLSNSRDITRNLKLQSDGKILVIGHTEVPINTANDGFILRYNANGSLDNSFGLNGRTTFKSTVPTNDIVHVCDLEIRPDKKIILLSAHPFSTFCISQFKTNGAPDSSFGVNGHAFLTQSAISLQRQGSQMLLQTDGRIVISGLFEDNNTPLNKAPAILRYTDKFSVGIKELSNGRNHVLLYPNPIAEKATIEYSIEKNEEHLRIELMEMNGSVIKSVLNKHVAKGKHYETIDFRNLSSGFYFLVLRTQSDQTTLKIQKR